MKHSNYIIDISICQDSFPPKFVQFTSDKIPTSVICNSKLDVRVVGESILGNQTLQIKLDNDS